MEDQEIILVDEKDQTVGTAEKMVVHKEGLLHRAFSVIVFNSKGELLLQRRAKSKYHCGGLWTNTCCSHPRSGETVLEAGRRRLFEEMGFDCELVELFSFLYSVTFPNGLTENEFDHVLVGKSDTPPKPNIDEVEDWKWISIKSLRAEMRKNPEIYTYWFKLLTRKLPQSVKFRRYYADIPYVLEWKSKRVEE